MGYALRNEVRWGSEDEAAFQALWPDYDAALPTRDKAFRTGYDPSKVPAGEAPPPTIQQIAAARAQILDFDSQVRAHEVPYALPLARYLRAAGGRLAPEVKLLAEQYAPYLLVYGIDVAPARGERIESITIRLAWGDGARRFVTHSLAPDTELEERVALDATVRQGVDLGLRIGLPSIPLQPGLEVAPGLSSDVKAGMLLHWEHRRLRAKVLALGTRSGWAEWTLNEAERLAGCVELRAVVLAPKRARKLAIAVSGEFRLAHTGIAFWRRPLTVGVTAEPISARLLSAADGKPT